MRIHTIATFAAGLCILALAGCGGGNAEENPKFTTEPYREIVPKDTAPATKDGKPVGFQ